MSTGQSKTICHTQNADEAGSDAAAEAGFSGGNALAAVSFSALYEALGKRLGNERTVLLLYDALHTCVYFQNYVLVRRWLASLRGSQIRLLDYGPRHSSGSCSGLTPRPGTSITPGCCCENAVPGPNLKLNLDRGGLRWQTLPVRARPKTHTGYFVSRHRSTATRVCLTPRLRLQQSGGAAAAAAAHAVHCARARALAPVHAAHHPAHPDPGRLLRRQRAQGAAQQRALVQGAPAQQDPPGCAPLAASMHSPLPDTTDTVLGVGGRTPRQ